MKAARDEYTKAIDNRLPPEETPRLKREEESVLCRRPVSVSVSDSVKKKLRKNTKKKEKRREANSDVTGQD